MSFNLFRTYQPTQQLQSQLHLIDVKQYYKQIANDFIPKYYAVYDTNFNELSNIYYPNSQFSYQDDEFIGFNALLEKLKINNIYKFTHYAMNVSVQPMGSENLVITIFGSMSVNDSILINHFIETLYIQRDNKNNFGVYSTIFKIIT